MIDDTLGTLLNVVPGHAQQFVAHRSANETGQSFARAERVEQPRHARPRAPLGGVEGQCHCNRRARLTMIAAVAPQILRPSQMIS